MRSILNFLFILCYLPSSMVFAAGNPEAYRQKKSHSDSQKERRLPSDVQEPGVVDTGSDAVSRASEQEATSGYLNNEFVGIKPQIGMLVFKDQLQNMASRVVEGVTVDGNLSKIINKDWNNIFLGPSIGLLFSHLGEPTSNFIGTNPNAGVNVGAASANVLIVPLNIKAGYNFNDNFRLAAHGGGNLIYQSVANSLNSGSNVNLPAAGGGQWSMYPNIGADAEYGLGKNIALMLRPDLTITPTSNIFTGTVALSFPLG